MCTINGMTFRAPLCMMYDISKLQRREHARKSEQIYTSSLFLKDLGCVI